MLDFLYSKLHNLHWEQFTVVGSTLLTFFFAAIVSFIGQFQRLRMHVSFAGFWEHCFPAAGWTSTSSRIDIIMYVAGKLTRGLLAIGDAFLAVGVASGIAAGLHSVMPQHVPLHAGFLTVVSWSIVFFLFADFANFFTHYLQHKVGFLWELHKVHHSATFLTPLTTARMHPLGDKFDHIGAILLGALPMGLCLFLYQLSLADMLIMMGNANLIGTILVLDALRHSHFPVSFGKLDFVLISPHMHQLHHSARFEHWDKNMGNKLSIWDFMFGTAFIPDKGEILTYGIGRGAALDAEYHTLAGVYVRPVINMFKVMVFGAQEPPPIPIEAPRATPSADHPSP
ncbi:hypothetical protein MMA231_04199 (plasmid) [Asticcacaulis sp. MM231]|uniref:sterol desaturase family protein n=1 Tax=Asticcacaulis sp. MM231 TaxID=3157666 RepID=UPI0032D584B0